MFAHINNVSKFLENEFFNNLTAMNIILSIK